MQHCWKQRMGDDRHPEPQDLVEYGRDMSYKGDNLIAAIEAYDNA